MDAYGACFVFFINQHQKKFLTEELKWNFILNTNYWADKAEYYKDLKNPAKAEECFKKAITNQDNINAVVQYALFLKSQDKFTEALDFFEQGITQINNSSSQIMNPEWWKDFILNQIGEINVILKN